MKWAFYFLFLLSQLAVAAPSDTVGLGIDPNDEAALRKAVAPVPMHPELVRCGQSFLECEKACRDADCISDCGSQDVECSKPWAP